MTATTPTYPVATIAKLLKISERRVQQLTQEGVIPKSDRGRYELAASVQGYVSFLQDRLSGNPDATEGGVDYQGQRTRKIAAEASLAEIELAKARGEVADLDLVRAEVLACFSACRSRLLSIGSTLAGRMDLATDMASRKELIDDAVIEALNEISSGEILALAPRADHVDPLDAVGDPAHGDAGADEADAEPMVGR